MLNKNYINEDQTKNESCVLKSTNTLIKKALRPLFAFTSQKSMVYSNIFKITVPFFYGDCLWRNSCKSSSAYYQNNIINKVFGSAHHLYDLS